MTDKWVMDTLNIEKIPEGKSLGYVRMFRRGSGDLVMVPVIAFKSGRSGPTLGIVSSLHGNELNGIEVIHKLSETIEISKLNGTVIMVPVANVPGFEAERRTFIDGTDLNRVMPGKKQGTPGEMYAYRLFHRLIVHFDYLIDLHTASFGRINSNYVRADLKNEVSFMLAMNANAQIIVHTLQPHNSLRGAAMAIGIPAITLELGNPQTFQEQMIERGYLGLKRIMGVLDMYPPSEEPMEDPVTCKRSFWVRTEYGGILTVYVKLLERVKKGQEIASIHTLHGEHIHTFKSPEDGIIVGRTVNPVATTGGRIVHLGIVGMPEHSHQEPMDISDLDYFDNYENEDQ